MIAAGNTNSGPRGANKIFGSLGQNDSAIDEAILKAIEDGVADGMDVLSMSFGAIFTPKLEDDPDVAAAERAVSLGVIVVATAGAPFLENSIRSVPSGSTVDLEYFQGKCRLSEPQP